MDLSVSHEFVYFCLLLFTIVYYCLLLFTFVYFCAMQSSRKILPFFQVIERNKRSKRFQDIEALSSPPLSPRPMMSSDPFDLRSSLSSAVFPHQSRGHRHFFTGTSSQGEPDMLMPMTNNGLQMQY
jgi:hypothetical protein